MIVTFSLTWWQFCRLTNEQQRRYRAFRRKLRLGAKQ